MALAAGSNRALLTGVAQDIIGMNQTCLVLGAGASCPYGFPIGRDLKLQLCQPTIAAPNNGVPSHAKVLLKKELLGCGFDESQIASFQESLAASTPFSIDRFLELRPEFEEIGKLAIATLITFYEARCRFKRVDDNDHLYRRIFQAVFPTPPQPIRSISIVTFNYDCSLEKYFIEKLCVDAGIDSEQARSIVEALRIHHVHGTTGIDRACWPTTNDSLRMASQSIRILHESSTTSDEHLRSVQDAVQNAGKIVFLGFGYDGRNLELLDIRNDWRPGTYGADFDHPPPPQKTVYGSCYQMRDIEVAAVRSQFNVSCKIDPLHRDWDALNFIRETGVLGSE